MDQFSSKLGIKPYPGTLNIKIYPEYENILRRIRSADGTHIDGFKDNERTFGAVKCFLFCRVLSIYFCSVSSIMKREAVCWLTFSSFASCPDDKYTVFPDPDSFFKTFTVL